MTRIRSWSNPLLDSALMLMLALGAACNEGTSADDSDAATVVDSDAANPPSESNRGTRYCEILLIYANEGELTAQVWGTVGLSDCPAESWEALNPESIQAQYGAFAIKMNGPRYGLVDTGSGFDSPDVEKRMFGELEMKRQAIREKPMLFSRNSKNLFNRDSWLLRYKEESNDKRGKKKAVVALARKPLKIAYGVLQTARITTRKNCFLLVERPGVSHRQVRMKG